MKYFFVPGRKWHLSLAELRSVFHIFNTNYVELSHAKDVCLFDVQADHDEVTQIFDRLGGFVKFGFIVEDPFAFLSDLSLEDRITKDEKIMFSVSFYRESGTERKNSREKSELGMQVKKWLRERGFRSRFVSNKTDAVTSAVLLKKNNVLEKGFELVSIEHTKSGKNIWGVTLGIQDFEGFSKRDFERPRANKEKGMLPPKLARIMINLAGQEPGKTIWDPFCGSGTVLMEAVLLGYSVIGTDIDETAVSESNENLKWLCDQNWVSHTQYKVFQHDILKGLPEGLRFDAVVSEPYLGPVLHKEISVNEIEEIMAEIYPLYDSLSSILERNAVKDGKVVVVIPGFKSTHGWLDMDPSFGDVEDVTVKFSSYPLQWDRPNSIIRRNIKIFSY